MKTPTAILLGGNKLNAGVFDKFKARGLQVIVVDWTAAPELPGDRHLQIDVKDSQRVLEALVQIGGLDVHAAYTSIDVAVPTVVAIHRHYGLAAPHGPPFERPLSKAQMTRVWQEAGRVALPGDIAAISGQVARGGLDPLVAEHFAMMHCSAPGVTATARPSRPVSFSCRGTR